MSYVSFPYFRLRGRVRAVGIDGDDTEIQGVEAAFLDAVNRSGGDGQGVATVVGFLVPGIATVGASAAPGDHARLSPQEQGAGGIHAGGGAGGAIEPNDVAVLVEDDPTILAQGVLVDRAGLIVGSFMDVQPVALGDAGAKLECLIRVHQEHE